MDAPPIFLPHSLGGAPLYVLLAIMPFFAIPIYLATWIVGLPIYLLLNRLQRLRMAYFVSLYGCLGALIELLVWWHPWHPLPHAATPDERRFAVIMVLISAATGAATGAAFARLLMSSRKPTDVAA